jgi:c-di-GMP-binding flagellar brake protein YcgR
MEENDFRERRKYVRIKANLDIKFLKPPLVTTEVKGFTTDISIKGLGLFTNLQLRPQDPIEIKLKNPLKDKSIYLKGTVVWSKAIDFSIYRIGVKLESLDLVAIAQLLET